MLEGLHDYDEDSDLNVDKPIYTEDTLSKLHDSLKEVAPEYDAIINVTAMPRSTPAIASLSDGYELFDEYERIKRYELHSSLLTAHLATTHLSPDGYILFNS